MMSETVARALIVEDDRSWQEILAEILIDAGLDVDVADSLEMARAMLRDRSHRLAVVDLSLGDGDYYNQDGLQVLDAVRRQDPGCTAIMLTGFATVELAVKVLTEHGAFSCLRKEAFSRDEFRALVRQALANAPRTAGKEPDSADIRQGSRQEEKITALRGAVSGPHTVLVVEDDAGWQSILSELLEDAGYEVRSCSSYGEALGYLGRERYTLAVVDLSLTGTPLVSPPIEVELTEAYLEGYRLLAKVKEAGIATIVVSGIVNPEAIEGAYADQGIFAYFEKQTFHRQAFMEAVREAKGVSELVDELSTLTDREHQVLELVAQGMTNKEIAQALFISANTVKRHLKAVFRKLDVHTRAAAAAKAVDAGISPEPTE
jgi:DNA-binding NarL/FixJ family response regulator